MNTYILNVLIYAFWRSISMLADILFCSNFMKRNKIQNKYIFLFSLISIFVGTAINMANTPILNLIFTILDILLLSNIFFEARILKKTLAAVICIFIPVFTEIISDYILQLIYSYEYAWMTLPYSLKLFVRLCENIFSFLILYMICRFKRSNYQSYISPKIYLVIIIVPIITMFSGVSIYISGMFESEDPAGKLLISIFFLVLLIINLANFFIFDYIACIYSSNMYLKVISVKNNLEINYYKKIIEDYEKRRKFHHDIKNFINTANKLLKDSSYGELEKLLAEMSSVANSNNSINICANKTVNAILFDKINICKNLGIDNLSIEVDFDLRLEKISTIDTVVILANLIDNAIEASREVDFPEIKIKIRNLQDEVFINISNKFKKIHLVSGKFLSTKSSPNNHGIGLKNVIDTVEKYNGYIDIKHENSFFTVEILI